MITPGLSNINHHHHQQLHPTHLRLRRTNNHIRSNMSTSKDTSTSGTSSRTVPAKVSSPAPKETGSASDTTPVVPKKKLTREEQEKIKKEEALARKKALDDRLKNRSKRRPAPTDDGSAESSKPAKKAKELTAYEKEVLEISKRSGLSDSGAGMRSLVK